ncbi:hypothetical protein C8A05DRAFT_40978 [Staphylotrichum tortipilum]|uniref:Uncharacterized protein n=1 Tax=Staphylotrichum tortipilum TaxID=2831512 RepID=A0AAN6RX47_9PEZI|nr:hypothetical protein C8A05DRAFT_40978 [Staphylotrichum longicolle]
MSHLVPRHLNDLHASIADNSDLIYPHTASALHPKAATAEAQDKVPDPTLFASLTQPTRGDSDLPTVGECAVHLELLEVFHKLRINVIRSSALDTTFGVRIEKRAVFQRGWDDAKRDYVMKPGHLKDETWGSRRRQKWSYFLEIAVGRFRVWIGKMDWFLKALGLEDRTRLPYLPPLDVLMVWHAFLLNPRDYDQACRRDSLTYVAALRFPWEAVHAAINRRDWKYTQPKASADWTQERANMEPDLFQFLGWAGKPSNGLSAALARYGVQPKAPIFSLDEALDTQGLNSRDAAFLAMLRQGELDKEANGLLVANVQRQAAFVDKMHAQLWIRSPALEGTLRRAGDRYDKFLRLFKLCPGQRLVPTLDIDLVWHTHQCSAAAYRASVEQRTGVFLNHDDKLGQPVLKVELERTRRPFFVHFGEDYEKCFCWECEMIASVLEDDDANGQQESLSTLTERVRVNVEYHRCVEILRRPPAL